MLNIDIKKAEHCFSDLIKKTADDGEITITEQGHPIVKLISVRKRRTKKRQFGSAKGLIKIADDFDATPENFKDYI
ncbi:type II toxin-antitoxin system Phd/YefM family antitoxin [Candidatus Electrothrix sp.]|uniref:type II toxin-antitoxin system Phd/YefM family antitoxin n=1 Tax=Candidatus Electrothrix sp. TaxID=2170559 RepID=UPI004057905A